MREVTHQQAMSTDILFIGDNTPLSQLLKQALGANCAYEQIPSLFDAGFYTTENLPQCVVIDCAVGDRAVLATANRLQQMANMTNAVIIALLREGDDMGKYDRNLFTEVLSKSCDVAHIVTRVKTHLQRAMNGA